MKTEDQVRTQAERILGFNEVEKGVQQDVGQITSFNQLGFKGILDKPDGWYLPSQSKPAIIAEFKDEKFSLDNQKFVDELLKNVKIVETKYSQTIGKCWKTNVQTTISISRNIRKVDN